MPIKSQKSTPETDVAYSSRNLISSPVQDGIAEEKHSSLISGRRLTR